MSLSIDPLRKSPGVRSHRKADAERAGDAPETESAGLPVPVGPPRTISSGAARVAGSAAIDAQVIGERRGLRAGPMIHDEAKSSYSRTEWSGSYDRRRPNGRVTRTEV